MILRFKYLKMLSCWPFLFDPFYPFAAHYYLMSQFDKCVSPQSLRICIFVLAFIWRQFFFLS